MIRFLFKWLFYLAILAGLVLIAYAYAGPFFGADFSAPQEQIRLPVTLHAK